MKTNGIVFVIENFYLFIFSVIVISIVLFTYDKYITNNTEEHNSDTSKSSFLADYDIKSSRVGFFGFLLVFILSYLIYKILN